MPLDRAIIEGFGGHAGSTDRELAEAVLTRGGRRDAWDAELTPAAIVFLREVATRLAEILWADDRRVDVPVRARSEARELIYSVERLDSPTILYAIAPWEMMPRGTIGDLVRASRAKLAEVLVPFIGRVLRSWADDRLIWDVGRPHVDSHPG